jgi:hypothetical protein
MSLFCFLIIPLFIAFRHSLSRSCGRKGLTLAFALGLIASFLRSAIGDVIPAGLFGFLRWVHLFIDRSAFPALLPLAGWALLRKFRGTTFDVELADFALIWLVPVAASRAIAWSASGNPAELVLMPLLWLSIVVGVPRLIDAAEEEFGIRAFGAATLAVLLPLIGTTAVWAFFTHRPLLGSFLFVICAAPATWSTVVSILQAEAAGGVGTTPMAGESDAER